MFTTFEAGRICGVFHTTVINWVNKGKLKARLTPGGHRRIALADLRDFMRKFDMPVPADLDDRAKRVLIVEDDLAVQRMYVRALQSIPLVEVQTCSSGLEALIAIGKEAPDLLVLDIFIPEVNGLDVCKLLKSSEHTKPVRIIAVSGKDLDESEKKFLELHTDGYFRKPLSVPKFKHRVAELLELETAEVQRA